MVAHRSVSQLSKYSECSEQYRLMYVDKVKVNAPAAWLAQGTAFHEAVDIWESSGRSPQVDIGQTYLLAYDREIEAMKTHQPDMARWLKAPKTKTEDDIATRRLRGVEQLRNYVEFAETSNFVIKDIDDYTLALEVPFEIELGGVTLKGAIDQILLLPDGVEVRDLKTGNRESGKIQVAVYVLVVEKIFKWPVKKASYYYAKDSKVVTISRQELDRYSESYLSELFSTLDKGITHGVFLPNPGTQCTLCPVRDYCREMGSQPQPLGSQP
jgi:putative RecB family exonuclease